MTKKKKKNAAKKTKFVEKQITPSYECPEAQGFFVFTLSLIILLSILSFAYGKGSYNKLGLVGYNIGWMFSSLLGLSSYIFCGALAWSGWRIMFSMPMVNPGVKATALFFLAFSFSILLSLVEAQFPGIADWIGNTFYTYQWQQKIHYHLGGAPFYYLYKEIPYVNFHRMFNSLGVGIIFFGMFATSILYLTKIRPATLLKTFIEWTQKAIAYCRQKNIRSDNRVDEALRYVKLRNHSTTVEEAVQQKTKDQTELMQIAPEKQLKERPSLSKKEIIEPSPSSFVEKKIEEKPQLPPIPPKTKRELALDGARVYQGDFEKFRIPPNTLLTASQKVDQSSLKVDLRKQAEVLEETLSSFGIEAKVGQINCGPTITSFEVHPAIGVKVQKIKALENDIALNLEAKSIRIIAPIPGKAAVGIEVPNAHPQEVAFKDLLAAYRQSGRKMQIPILLGKAVNGDYVMSDLTKMPHCIIAGATGSGKSVCINTIVMSILLNARPDEIKLIMVDPKKVELTPYSELPHMLAPVITEPQGAVAALKWLVKEMETRYEILKQIGVRNIDAFNSRTIDEPFEANLKIDIPKKMCYIVCIIDELADLMMVASSDIETPIARIAQMARAVGIHLILATQRPSREVITGLIKANFPTRISFKVASRVNSQIILDEVGAESLLGNGDLLFLPPGSSHLIRAQGAYIRDGDINAVVKFICEQAPPNYLIKSFDYLDRDDSAIEEEEPNDPLYTEARSIVVSTGNASTTFLQRKLKIGYARAASLIDELERRGVVGPLEGSKPRRILVASPAGSNEREEEGEEETKEDEVPLLRLE